MISLQPSGRPEFRVRHRDFLARVDRIGPHSDQGARNDARFLVRPGFVSHGCIALESVNFPGYFLRHRDFVIRLDPMDAGRVFAKDATFCPVPVPDGAAVNLQSANFRSRYVNVRWGRLFLDETTPDRATAFVVRPAL